MPGLESNNVSMRTPALQKNQITFTFLKHFLINLNSSFDNVNVITIHAVSLERLKYFALDPEHFHRR